MNFLKFMWAHQKLPLLIFLLALGTSVYFGGQFVARAVYFNDPKHQQQPIEPWMTPRYVSMSYRLPPEEMRDLLQLQPEAGARPRMGEIATDLGMSLAEIETMIKTRVQEMRPEKRGDKQ